MEQLLTVRQLYKDTAAYADKAVTFSGWVRNLRASKAFGFIMISDGTFFTPVQVVYHDTLENFAAISKLNIGAALIVTGKLVLTPDAKQPFEIQAERVTIEGPSTPDFPVQPKRHTMEYLRTIPHLRPRTNTFQAVFRVRSLAAYAIHRFFQERGFVYVHTPHHHRQRLRGRRRDVPGHHAGRRTTRPRTEDGEVDYSQGLLRQAHQPDRLRPAQRRDLRHGLPQHLHLRPDLPRRKLQHAPATPPNSG